LNKLSLHSPYIPKAATLIAAILLGLSVAKAVNLWLQANNTPSQEQVTSPAQLKTNSINKKADYTKLTRLHLMGKVEKGAKKPTTVQKITNAPETRLKLKLLGVIFNGDTDDGIAIISDNKKAQKTFHRGDKVFGNATLYAVEPNRVILMRNGRHETLTLIKPDLNTVRSSSKDGGASATTSKRLIKSRNNATKSSLIKSTATSPMASRPI
jgi:general secretion pathway protein C